MLDMCLTQTLQQQFLFTLAGALNTPFACVSPFSLKITEGTCRSARIQLDPWFVLPFHTPMNKHHYKK